jgi:3',5'-cyclic AMP phosphodiesterase CpdA
MVEDRTEIRIAHISDLHFTSQMAWSKRDENNDDIVRFTALKRDLVEQKPHALMVTGDIADNTTWELNDNLLEQAWTNALDFLTDVCSELFPQSSEYSDRLFIIPGNHDAKILGNITREELVKLMSHRWFRLGRFFFGKAAKHLSKRLDVVGYYEQVSPIFDAKMEQAVQSIPSDSQRFAKIFGHFMESRRVAGFNIFAFCIDSNFQKDSYLNFAQGTVSAVQADRLAQASKRLRTDPDFEHAYKLALVHHHPMPIPLAESPPTRFEGDEFHLMRNAGSFMKVCLDLGIDFILHGHQHAEGCSVVEFPRHERDENGQEKRRVVILGAGSVQDGRRNNICSYNLLRILPNHECKVDVRHRAYRSIEPQYDLSRQFPLVSNEDYRRRLNANSNFDIKVGRLDIFAAIDSCGDLTADYFARRVRPTNGKPALKEYPVFFMNESARATVTARSFTDTHKLPNAVEGGIKFKEPATQDNPQDTAWSVEGAGIYTFSEEYCGWHKGTKQEQFGIRITKSYDELYIDLEFPKVFQLVNPRPEAIRTVTELTPEERNVGVHTLLAQRKAVIDDAETAVCREGFRMSPQNRVTLLVSHPLPGLFYRIVWDLLKTEYDVLPDNSDQDDPNRMLRSRVRAVVHALHQRFHSLHTSTEERRLVHQFLSNCAVQLSQTFGIQERFRIDLAVIDPTGTIIVVAAGQLEKTVYGASDLLPECKLGETLRGKAYLQRAIRYYSPGIPDSEKDPNRNEMEKMTKHQIAFLLLYPPELPYFPRLGVVTISSESEISAFFEIQRRPQAQGAILLLHEGLRLLAQELHLPFPSYTELD